MVRNRHSWGVSRYAPTGRLVIGIMIAAGLLTLAALLVTARDAAAQGGGFDLPPGVTWDDVNNIAHKMYCDVCEGIPLDECESVACRQWREEIARQLGDGRTEDEIMDYFVERYGADVAALPRGTTDRLLALAVPVILLLVVGVVGGRQVMQYRKRGAQAGQVVRRTQDERLRERPVPNGVDPRLLERLARELEGPEA